jgi:hypothetical protein
MFAALSAGWLVPLFFAGSNFRAYLETELLPNITGRPLTHSFPNLLVCHFWFAVSLLWLGLVIFCWSLYFLRRPV